MIAALMSDPVVIVKRGVTGTDRLGKDVYGDVARINTVGRLEQVGSVEGEEYVANRWRAYLLVDEDVTALDVIEAQGKRFQLDGEPAVNSIAGFPATDHLLAQLTYVGRAG